MIIFDIELVQETLRRIHEVVWIYTQYKLDEYGTEWSLNHIDLSESLSNEINFTLTRTEGCRGYYDTYKKYVSIPLDYINMPDQEIHAIYQKAQQKFEEAEAKKAVEQKTKQIDYDKQRRMEQYLELRKEFDN